MGPREEIGFWKKWVTGSKQMVKGLEKLLDFQNGPKQIAKRIWAKCKTVHFENEKYCKKIEKGDPNAPFIEPLSRYKNKTRWT